MPYDHPLPSIGSFATAPRASRQDESDAPDLEPAPAPLDESCRRRTTVLFGENGVCGGDPVHLVAFLLHQSQRWTRTSLYSDRRLSSQEDIEIPEDLRELRQRGSPIDQVSLEQIEIAFSLGQTLVPLHEDPLLLDVGIRRVHLLPLDPLTPVGHRMLRATLPGRARKSSRTTIHLAYPLLDALDQCLLDPGEFVELDRERFDSGMPIFVCGLPLEHEGIVAKLPRAALTWHHRPGVRLGIPRPDSSLGLLGLSLARGPIRSDGAAIDCSSDLRALHRLGLGRHQHRGRSIESTELRIGGACPGDDFVRFLADISALRYSR